MTVKKIKIECGDRLINELGNNNCTFISLLSELIDNVAAELIYCKHAKVEITIGGVWSVNPTNKTKSLILEQSFIEVEDNATGIRFSDLATALSLAKTESQIWGLHEHGLGLKTAIVSLGTLDYLVTRSKDDPVAHRIEKLVAQGEIDVKEETEYRNVGTKIRIKQLKPKVLKRKDDYTKYIIDHLGARYSSLLHGTIDGKKIEISLKLTDEHGVVVQDSNGQLACWNICPQFPMYQNNRPKIDKELKGKNWAAHLQFGFAPNEDEFQQHNLKKPPSHHPYNSWSKKIDVVMHDRTLERIDISKFGENVKYGNAAFAPYVGVLILRHGFKTSMTKDGVLHDENWEELSLQVAELIAPEIKAKIHAQNKLVEDEKYYKEKLGVMQEIGEEKEVFREYAVEGCDGNIDLLVEKEVWELKAEQACGQDVYQVLFYIDNCKEAIQDRGRLIAPSFSEGCKYAAENLFQKRGIRIKLKTFKDVGLEGG